MASQELIRFDRITKRFGGVVALADVSFAIARGSTHALMGENGAGKSTLGNILGGVHRPSAGRVVFDGAPVAFADPRAALAAGIAIVHQELAFCPNLTVAQNLGLGDLPRRGPLIDRRAMRERAHALLSGIDADLDVDVEMGGLSTGQKQLIQIAHAVGSGARVIVFDEPTSSLSQAETEQLFALIDRLRADGVTMVYVSHRMPEIARLCDALTVLRDGRHIETGPIADFPESRTVRLMAGREIDTAVCASARHAPDVLDASDARDATAAESTDGAPAPALAVRGLSVAGQFRDVSFDVRCGEIVGLAGLVGSGRSEIARTIFGLQAPDRGQVELAGRPARIRSPRDAMRLGVGLLPEDRKQEGLVLPLSVARNTSLPSLPELSTRGWLAPSTERALADRMIRALSIKTPDGATDVQNLSGGNQQKVALARWLARDASVLLLDEPTRGVDVGAKAEIHRLILRLASEGKAIVLISSELPEVSALSDRVLVMRAGRLAAEIDRRDEPEPARQERILTAMTGARRPAPAE